MCSHFLAISHSTVYSPLFVKSLPESIAPNLFAMRGILSVPNIWTVFGDPPQNRAKHIAYGANEYPWHVLIQCSGWAARAFCCCLLSCQSKGRRLLHNFESKQQGKVAFLDDGRKKKMTKQAKFRWHSWFRSSSWVQLGQALFVVL